MRALAAERAASSTKGLATAHSDSARGRRPAVRKAAAVRSSCSAPGSRPVGASTSRSGWLPDTSSSASAAAPARSPFGLHPARCSRRASSAPRERSCTASVPDQLPAPGVSACQPNTLPVAPTWAATVATVQPPTSRPASGTAGCAGALLPLQVGALCVTAQLGAKRKTNSWHWAAAHQGESLLSIAGHVVATGRSGYRPAPNAPVDHRLASWSPRLRSRVSSGALARNSVSSRPAALSAGRSEPVSLAVLGKLQASPLRGWALALVRRAAHRRLAHRPRTSQSITSSQTGLQCCLVHIYPCYKAQQHITPS